MVETTAAREWLQTGLLRGTQSMPGAPWRVVLDQETRRKLTAQDAPPGWVELTEAARRLGSSVGACMNGCRRERRAQVDPLGPLHQEPERILASELPSASYLRPLLDVLLDARPVLGALGEAA